MSGHQERVGPNEIKYYEHIYLSPASANYYANYNLTDSFRAKGYNVIDTGSELVVHRGETIPGTPGELARNDLYWPWIVYAISRVVSPIPQNRMAVRRSIKMKP